MSHKCTVLALRIVNQTEMHCCEAQRARMRVVFVVHLLQFIAVTNGCQ